MKARTDDQIRNTLLTIKDSGRPDMEVIHLHMPDFEKVKRCPIRFDCSTETDGNIVTLFGSRLITVVGIE